ncbi:MAG TPA: FkbM family methyltransferase [Burkholderiaceae bacterium]
MSSTVDKAVNVEYLGEVYRTGQGWFCVDPVDQYVAKTLIETGSFGSGQLGLLQRFCGEDSSVLLLGAHIGTIAVPLSKRVKNLTVFEANPRTYQFLSANLKLNDCANVEAFNLAANDKNTELQFVLNTVNSGGSKRFPVHQDHAYFYDNPDVAMVKAVRLDDFLKGKRYDLVFMDIEGSEYFAIKGMPQLMAEAQVLFMEFLPHHISRVAGVSIEQFVECLSGFETMIKPSIPAAYHGDAIRTTLIDMFHAGIGEEELIFARGHFDVVFGPGAP